MAAPRVLVVDDESSIRRALREVLEYENLAVEEAADGIAALEKLSKRSYDAVLLDIKMPRKDGLEVLAECVETWPGIPVIMISGHADIRTAVEATQMGAFHFIEKPPDLRQLLVTMRSALNRGKLLLENRRLRLAIKQRREGGLDEILGDSQAMEQIRATIARVAPTEARVLITGQPGTGKELAARWIHHLSDRANGPLVEVNCAAIPSELIESELFGHEKGSFTGATKRRTGKFEQAHRGTLFLDEIGDMSLSAQAKVLRALQENRITRVGGDRTIPVDIRIVAATNKNLRKCIKEGKFREDLYHRLSVILLELPPMHEHHEDVPILIRQFAKRVARQNGMKPKVFSDDAIRKLEWLPWRGNVREIRNVVERLLILSLGNEVTAQDVGRYVNVTGTAVPDLYELFSEAIDLKSFRERAETLFLERTLIEHNWNVSRTAEQLGLQRSQLYTRIKRYNISKNA